MQKIKIGVMGCASIAQRSFIPAIQQLPDHYELVACASRDIAKAQSFASEFHCSPMGSYEQMVASADIDALYIPLPTGLHKEWINKALLNGKHVYAEKSIAMCYPDACEMVENAKKNNLSLMEGFMFQYHQQHQHLRQLVQSGAIGELRHFSAAFGFPPLSPGNFRYDPLIGGGVLTDAAGYPLRAAHFILGNDLEVTASSLYNDPNTHTGVYGSAYLSGKNGIGAAISFGFDNFYQCQYQLWGSKGKITATKAFTPKVDEVTHFILETQGRTEVIQSVADNHFMKALLEFHETIFNNEKKGKHYTDILIQSKNMDAIKQYSK